jgi:hypothetical protein
LVVAVVAQAMEVIPYLVLEQPLVVEVVDIQTVVLEVAVAVLVQIRLMMLVLVDHQLKRHKLDLLFMAPLVEIEILSVVVLVEVVLVPPVQMLLHLVVVVVV